EVTNVNETKIEFIFKGNIVRFFPYSGWHTGKSITDGRGWANLVKQLPSAIDCEKCGNDKAVIFCTSCDDAVCADCKAEYDEFTKADYDCCQGCVKDDL